jgi:3-carboxy-cis,cis-muconate cycloisomerase
MAARLIDSLGTTDELADLFSDRAVLAALLAFEAALARAQARLGMIPNSAAEAITRVANADDADARFDAAAIARQARDSATIGVPLVNALTARVRELDETSACFVHWGATSQDLVDTAMALLLRRAEEILARDHARLQHLLRELSERHSGTLMLARTLLQPAAPTTFGYKVAGWYGATNRAWKKLRESFHEAIALQFGGAAGTLAAYGSDGPALAVEFARELELSPAVPCHTHRDRLAALAAHCGIYTASLGKIGRDIALLMQYEVGELAEAGGRSSAMPHKRNPAGCAIALAAATRVPGLVSSFLTAMVQEHERAVGGWQAEWQVQSDLLQTTGSALAAMLAVVEGLTVYPDRMRANLDNTYGVVLTEKAAMWIAVKVGREQARALLDDAARQAVAAQRPLQDILRAWPGISAVLTPEQIDSLGRPEDYLGAAEEFRKQLLQE